jgi:hypothetical protein
MLKPIDEIRFWTGILRDHGEFILMSLSYNEQEAIQLANYYKASFSKLHEISNSFDGMNNFDSILHECRNLLVSFIDFKRVLLKRLLECQLNTSLPPTFYNHMINEAMEFYKILFNLQTNAHKNTVLENLNFHKLWIPDAAGHAAIIASDLDPTEKCLIYEAQDFEKCFNALAIKTDELSKMLERTGLNDGALKHLNEEAKKKIEEFVCYLNKLRDLKLKCKVLGILKVLTPDHMIREENYYLQKIMSF